MSEFYSISELAQEFDVTTRTMRFYEDKGLISPKREGQRRIYTAADRVRLKLILRGRRLGFSLEESKELIELYEPKSGNKTQMKRYLEKIRVKQESLNQQMNDLKALQKELKHAEDACIKAISS